MARPTVRNRVNAKIHGALSSLGWDLRRIDSELVEERRRSRSLVQGVTEFELTMHVLLRERGELSVVQVGANDGGVADPINAFMMEYADHTRVLLIEPQAHLMPYLAQSYRDHPNATLGNYAIGKRGTLELFAVDPACWADCPSPAGWPEYRDPSGVTSSDRGHVERWVESHYRGPRETQDVVQSLSSVSLPLLDVMERVGFGTSMDVLQVDAEGADDLVIYECSIDTLKPAIINFEHVHLEWDRFESLIQFIQDAGYRLYVGREDTLAVLSATP